MKVYYNQNGTLDDVTGDSIFAQSSDSNVLQIKIDYPETSALQTVFLVPDGEGGVAPAEPLVMSVVPDYADGGYMWQALIGAEYLEGAGKAYLSVRVLNESETVIKTTRLVQFDIEESGSYEPTGITTEQADQILLLVAAAQVDILALQEKDLDLKALEVYKADAVVSGTSSNILDLLVTVPDTVTEELINTYGLSVQIKPADETDDIATLIGGSSVTNAFNVYITVTNESLETVISRRFVLYPYNLQYNVDLYKVNMPINNQLDTYVFDDTYCYSQKTIYKPATTSINGLMSSTDKSRLDALQANAVRITAQTFTEGQKLQARTNIGALSQALIDGKLDRVETGSKNQVYGVNESNAQVMVEIETAPTLASTKLVNSNGIAVAISNAVTGSVIYKGLWDSTGQTDYSSLNSFRPIKAGWRWEVTGTGATIDTVEYKAGDFITFNQDVSAFTTILTSMIDKTDNTDIVTSVNGEVGTVELDAEDIPFDNTESGLTATDTQAAIDEIVGIIPADVSDLTDTTNLISSKLSADNIGTITLLSTGWTLVSGLYEYEFTDAGLTLVTDKVEMTPLNVDIDIVIAAQILPYIYVWDDSGTITATVYAKNAPTADIDVEVEIVKGVI